MRILNKSRVSVFARVVTLAIVAGVAAPASAAADTWTDYFTIDGMDNGDGGTSITLAVSSASGDFTGSTSNPHGCSVTTYALMSSALSSTAKDLDNRVLLAAFLAGKQVRLRISGTLCMNNGTTTTGTTGSPAFTFVGVKE
jgi:hypothetical protein